VLFVTRSLRATSTQEWAIPPAEGLSTGSTSATSLTCYSYSTTPGGQPSSRNIHHFGSTKMFNVPASVDHHLSLSLSLVSHSLTRDSSGCSCNN
jgi:hypothetical protein